jgi:hypothetical protein
MAIAAVVFAVIFAVSAVVNPDWNWSGVLPAAIFPIVFSAAALYTTRKSGKMTGRVVAWVAVALTVIALVVASGRAIATQHADRAEQCGDLAWPSTGLAAMLPSPESKEGKIDYDNADSLSVDVCNVSQQQFKSYVDAVKKKGFTVDYSNSSDSYSAQNADGYSLSLYYGLADVEDTLSISLDVPQTDKPDDGSASTDNNQSTDGADDGAGDPPADSDNTAGSDDATQAPSTSSDFRTTMDSYEQFMNKYVEFMKKYQSDGQPVSMLKDYTDMMQQYADYASKVSALDDGSLSAEDLSYYTQVVGRVTQKLAEVQ